MKFVIKHPTLNAFLRAPRFVGDTVQWTSPGLPGPISARTPWVFATRSGAEKARDMHALEASVEPWYEAGDVADSEQPPMPKVQHVNDVRPAPTYVTSTPPMQDYLLGAVLGELTVLGSSDCSGF